MAAIMSGFKDGGRVSVPVVLEFTEKNLIYLSFIQNRKNFDASTTII